MPSYIGYAYDGLTYTPGRNSWSLRAGFDPMEHRVEFQFADVDGNGAPDIAIDEVGDSIQFGATVRDMTGQEIAGGLVFCDEYYELEGPGGDTIYVDRIEVGGATVGYSTTAPLQSGVAYTHLGAYSALSPHSEDHSALKDVACFGPNTRITTDKGQLPVSWIGRGTKVLTRDDGFQPVRWAGRFHIPLLKMRRNPKFAPVRVRADMVDQDCGDQFVELSAAHRVILSGADVQLLFGEEEVLATAKFLAEPEKPKISKRHYTYHPVLFSRHQVVQANGFWVESLFLPPHGTGMAPGGGLFSPRGLSHGRSARLCLTRTQTEFLVQMRKNNLWTQARLSA